MKILVKKFPINARTEQESEIMTSIPGWCDQETGLPLTDGEGVYTYAMAEIPETLDLEDLSVDDFEVHRFQFEKVEDDGTMTTRQVFTAIYLASSTDVSNKGEEIAALRARLAELESDL